MMQHRAGFVQEKPSFRLDEEIPPPPPLANESSAEKEKTRRSSKQPSIPSIWKESPDLYFSWALSCCALSEGHLFVDLLPPTGQLINLKKEEKEMIGKRFENACREYLDTQHIVRIVSDRDMAPDFLYFLLATNIQQLSPTQPQKPSGRDEQLDPRGNVSKRNQSTHSSRFKMSERDRSRAGYKTHKTVKGRNIKQRTASIHQSPAPLVVIVQDIEFLPHKTQMALVEVLTKKVMPVSLVTNVFGGAESAALVPGQFEIKLPIVFVALSTGLFVPNLDYSPEASSGEISPVSIAPTLFQSFMMRIPIRMQERALILCDLFQSSNASKEVDDEPYGGVAKSTIPHQQTPEPGAHRKLLWPTDAVLVGSHAIAKPSRYDDLKPHRISRLDLRSLRDRASNTYVSFEMEMHLNNIISALRMHPFVLSGPASSTYQMLLNCVKAVSGVIKGNSFVTPSDVTDVVVEVLSHQITLSLSVFPHVTQALESNQPSHPKDWHPLTASRYVVAQSAQFYVPAPR